MNKKVIVGSNIVGGYLLLASAGSYTALPSPSNVSRYGSLVVMEAVGPLAPRPYEPPLHDEKFTLSRQAAILEKREKVPSSDNYIPADEPICNFPLQRINSSRRQNPNKDKI